MATLKLGTRRSLLAWAQSSWVAREIERLHPEVKVDLVGIETRGDRILDVSLQSIQGKEFFVAELDEALQSGKVDLTVHSMKDLSLERPGEFVLAAIPKRENPRDVVLYGPGVLDSLSAGKRLRIGTSSPRRLENIPGFLEKALPRVNGKTSGVELIEIRGNVNSRLSRVQEASGSERHLDAVVLAFAGMIRLWADVSGRAELEKLLSGVRWMVLPLAQCPAAPAQGALAIECRKDRPDVQKILAALHYSPTSEQVAAERALLALWGGGCHQKFGATAIRHAEVGQLLYIRGRKPDETFVDELRWTRPSATAVSKPVLWDGALQRARLSEEEPERKRKLSFSEGPVFIAHSRALPEGLESALEKTRVWTSGVSSWHRLAERGVWVEGCAEGLGYDELLPTLCEKVLRLGNREQWTVLTHDSATGWTDETVIRTYSVPERISDEGMESLKEATHIFWSSGSQFDLLGNKASSGAHHACGPGKTAHHLREAGIRVDVFPSVEEWRKWLS